MKLMGKVEDVLYMKLMGKVEDRGFLKGCFFKDNRPKLIKKSICLKKRW